MSKRGLLDSKKIIQSPELVSKLSEFIGEVTPENVKKFIKKGKEKLKSAFESIKKFLTKKSEIPTLQQLIKKTAVGANVSEWFNENIKPKADQIQELLDQYLPTLQRPMLAAIYGFIWLNVDELSWEWGSIVDGFTGNIELHELLANLPEAAISFVSSMFFGIGYQIMPAMIAIRLIWLAKNDYIRWEDGWKPNFGKIDKEKFENAEQDPAYDKVDF